MAVTILTSNRNSIGEWVLTFESDETTPVTFYVYLDGILSDVIRSTTGYGEFRTWVAPNENTVLEILDKNCLAQHAFPPRFTLNWLAISTADRYRIDRYVGAAWVEQDTVREVGQLSYTYLTVKLEDETTHQFRIVPVDANGIDGTALSFTKLMVRHPDVPALNLSLGGNVLTISA